jgi:hypothetical protein
MEGGGHVTCPVCTSCNVWIVREITQLVLETKVIQKLTRNLPKYGMPVMVAVKFPQEPSPFQCSADGKLMSSVQSRRVSCQSVSVQSVGVVCY